MMQRSATLEHSLSLSIVYLKLDLCWMDENYNCTSAQIYTKDMKDMNPRLPYATSALALL